MEKRLAVGGWRLAIGEESLARAAVASGLRPDSMVSLRPDSMVSLRPDSMVGLRPDSMVSLRPDSMVSLRLNRIVSLRLDTRRPPSNRQPPTANR
jgi:hypothetical protein